MNKKRLWLIPVVVVGGSAIAYVLFSGSGSGKVQYRTEKIDRGDIAISISATGTLNALTTVQVGSQVSGTIARLYVDYNSTVSRGDIIAQLDPTFLQASVNEQRANVARSSAQVHEAERNFARTTELFAKELVSQADMDMVTTSLETSGATLRQAEAALERAEVNLRYATIRAPISGVVISRNVDVGQTVAASLSAPTLFTIANDLRKMQVEASIDEADIGNVAVGQAVRFRVDSYPEEEFQGTVTQVRLAPIITQNVVTYTVVIGVDNRDLRLKPGMTATVTIEVTKKEDILRLPIGAVRFTPPDDILSSLREERKERRTGGEGDSLRERPAGRRGMISEKDRARVWMMVDGKMRPVSLRRGIQNIQFIEIVESELKEGDEVIVGMISSQATVTSQQTNPFAPRGPTGGGRRGF